MNAAQCDQCGTFAPNPDNRVRELGYRGRLPDGWVSLYAGNRTLDQAQDPSVVEGEFCGLECAGHYVLAQARQQP